MAKHLDIRIKLEGAAFDSDFADLEVTAILRTLAQKIGAGALNGSHTLEVGYGVGIFDSNGQNVGTAEVKDR